ncbi:MAG: restriction endonuclease subunit S, partial [Candidatus Taylorbacteria bacterium]|nr:restriction endonuclease subunit S [Candidatus Taylorbacteria bacterium]
YLSRQTEQVNLNNVEVGDVLVPLASEDFMNKIHSLHTQTHDLTVQSKKFYEEAENILLKELGLDIHKQSDDAISVRNLAECLQDNRFDAEYWQPEYDSIIKKINSYRLGSSLISAEFKQIKSNFKPIEKQDYNYIEIGDVNVFTGEVNSNSIQAEELPANAKIMFGKRQLITSKVRPNRGATAVLDNHDGYIGSGAFVVLQEKESINLETLMVYLRLQPIKELLLRYNTGISYPTITDSDLLKLPVPLIDKKVQKKITELVISAKKQRLKAKELLEKAKLAVEVFIEKDEVEAFKILK